MRNTFYLLCLFACLFAGCSSPSKESETGAEAEAGGVKTPVTVTTVSKSPIKETLDLNAVSAYQDKNTVKAGIDGYIQKVFLKLGEHVRAGAPLFTMKTKEAQVLGDLMKQDSSLRFNGVITVKAPASGVVLELNHQAGDYVNDGEQVAVISELKSFVFLVNVPFELNQYTTTGTSVMIILPDSTKIPGTILSELAVINATTQTQQFVIKPLTDIILPENLEAVARLTKEARTSTQVVPKEAVLTNETMDAYWVMKLLNDTTAVKVPVKTGISTEHTVEILSPDFAPSDRLLISGNYGLPDTAYVSIQTRQAE